MPLREQLLTCMRTNNVEVFNQILDDNDTAALSPLMQDGLYQVALFSSAKILNRLLEIPAFIEHLSTIHASRGSFLSTAMSNSNMAVLEIIFKTKLFYDDIVQDPYAAVLALASNRKSAPMALKKLQDYINVDQYITQNNNQIWLTAFVNGNYPAMNIFLEFPAVFESIDLNRTFREQREYIDTYFMEYYFKKLPNKDLTTQETELAYLVLQNLIRTYPQRDQIRQEVKMHAEREEDNRHSNTFFYRSSKNLNHLRETYLSKPENVHAQRIEKLMCIPAVLLKAEKNSAISRDTVLSAAKLILEESNLQPRSRLRG